jgi:hypothetical protein
VTNAAHLPARTNGFLSAPQRLAAACHTLKEHEAPNAPAFEYADDHRAYREERLAHEGERIAAERVARALVGAAGGPFIQRQPTGAQCLTGLLDGLAEKHAESRAWLRSSFGGRSVLLRHGLTVEQVERWAAREYAALGVGR